MIKEMTMSEILYFPQILCDDCRRRLNELLEGTIDVFTLCPEYHSRYHVVFEKDNVKNDKPLLGGEEFQQSLHRAIESFNELAQQLQSMELIFNREIDEVDIAVQIANLESRKKHCKNYLELKQIDRELNALKWGRNRRKQND